MPDETRLREQARGAIQQLELEIQFAHDGSSPGRCFAAGELERTKPRT